MDRSFGKPGLASVQTCRISGIRLSSSRFDFDCITLTHTYTPLASTRHCSLRLIMYVFIKFRLCSEIAVCLSSLTKHFMFIYVSQRDFADVIFSPSFTLSPPFEQCDLSLDARFRVSFSAAHSAARLLASSITLVPLHFSLTSASTHLFSFTLVQLVRFGPTRSCFESGSFFFFTSLFVAPQFPAPTCRRHVLFRFFPLLGR